MSHIILTQIRDGEEFPMLVKVDILDYTNQSSRSRGQFINLNDKISSIEVKESAVEIKSKIDDAMQRELDYLCYLSGRR